MFRVSVGDLARLPDQGGVDHVPARHLLVQVLQAEEEGSVTEPGHAGLRHPLEVHVAGEDGQVGVRDGGGVAGRMTIGHQYVNQELKRKKLMTSICLEPVRLQTPDMLTSITYFLTFYCDNVDHQTIFES